MHKLADTAVGGVRCISIGGVDTSRAGDGALLMLFPPGKRPDTRALRQAAQSTARTTVTFELDEGRAIELLRDGMTYDLVGLAPGTPIPIDPARHSIGFGADGVGDGLEAVAIRPGPHIAAGARSMPVVRTLAGIGAELAAQLPDLAAIGWPPASIRVAPTFFVSTVSGWLEGGPFPALGLTAFAVDPGGALRSEGLAWFGGQEIAIDASLAADRAAATRLAVRLVNQLAGRGRVEAAELVVGPDGERLLLEPAENGATVRVRRGVTAGQRERLTFRSVNRPGSRAYDPALQRHHVLPCQLLIRRSFARLFDAIDVRRVGFDDFRRNGLLLPAKASAARRLGLPLHRGPHRHYNALVIERVGQVEAHWARRRARCPVGAGDEAVFRIALIQSALRRRLLDPPGRPLVLNRHDPLGTGFDFTELDAMAETLWGGTQIALAARSSFAV